MKRTSKGRVVYDRKVHYYKPRDVVRILLRMNWELYDPGEVFDDIAKIIEMVSIGVGRTLVRVVQDPAGEIGKKVRRVFDVTVTLIGALAIWIGSTLRDLLGF